MVALLAVSAWVTIPFGPVPFTLQTLVLAMIIAALDGAASVLAIGSYVLLGALGLPVFSGFMGGVGALFGPTGGFLWGFVLGVVLVAALARLMGDVPVYPRALACSALTLLVSYVCGTAQLMALMSLGATEALAIAVLPFVVPDAVKVVIGARIGCAAKRALGRIR